MHPSDPVNRVMTEPAVSVDIGAPAGEVLRLFAAHKFHHLPVVERGRVVGMLSSADVLKLEAFLPKHGGNPAEFLNQHLQIGRLMRKPPITVTGTTPVERAADLMTKSGIHALPVVDSADRLLGIITTTDIINAVLHEGRWNRADGASGTGAAAGPGDDSGQAARALHRAQSRVRVLEHVLSCADRYVSAGQDQSLHGLLVKAITEAKEDGAKSLRDRL
jgi:acetoin utilization protein AcuB